VCRELVLAAGERALEIRAAGITREAKALQDFVTDADRETEETIRGSLGKHYPNDGVLGEERGLELPESAATAMDAEGLWILDPIDGTSNFAAGIDAWCVSLAYVKKGVTELGAIYAPERGELYLARRGEGAWLGERRLSISGGVPPQQALIMTGRGSAQPVDMHLEVLRRLLDRGFEYRRCGSGALGLAEVATGRLQGYAEPGMYAWDVAAARLIVAEAGGEISPFPLESPTQELGPLVVGCQPGFLETLVETVRF
jgi:myo-inositol-1(or 4)-monophosphatase